MLFWTEYSNMTFTCATAVLSDLDEALERAEKGTCMDEDVESELQDSFIQIFAEE